MKIIVLHGDDVEKSYRRLTVFIKEAKRRGWDIVNDKIEETPSLFGTEKLIILRDYKVLGEKELTLVKNIPGTLIIYNQKSTPAGFIKTLPKETKIEKYELPFLLWKFLDAFDINIFQEVTKNQPVEMIFAMMARRLRDLYWVKVGKPKMNAWQLSKLQKQGSRWTKKELAEIIHEMAQIDVKSKTGGASLKDSLDLLIVKRLS